MSYHHLIRLVLALVLLALTVFPASAQDEIQHVEAHEALKKVIKEVNFGELAFGKTRLVTVKDNDKVPGMAGLAFVYYLNETINQRVQVSIQWFETGKDLYKFYAMTRRSDELLKPKTIGEGDDAETILAHEEQDEQRYQWSDGEHFLVSIGGAGVPIEMVTVYLESISSDVPELEEKLENEEQGE